VNLTNLGVIVTLLALVQVIIAFRINRHSERKNLQIKIMQGCIEQYRKFVDDDRVSQENVRAYLGSPLKILFL